MTLRVTSENNAVVIAMHNTGTPIPSEQKATLFDGGEVDVTSGDEDGTTFTMRLPKQDGDDDDRRSAIDTHPAVTSCSEFDD